MNWVPRILGALTLLAVTSAHSETLTYELYELSHNGERLLIANGDREYAIREVLVDDRSFGGDQWRVKELPITKGFSVGGSIYREKDLTGFGLWLRDRGSLIGKLAQGGFSWDWFDRESRNMYRKRQGGGRVRVFFVPSGQFQEIASIEVLEDITLRVNNRPWFFFTESDTHNLVLKKGSILRFAP